MYDARTTELDRTVFFLDILGTIGAFFLSYEARIFFLLEEGALGFSSHLFLLPLQLALIISFLHYFGGYRAPRDTSVAAYFWSVFRSVSISFGVLLSLLFFLDIRYVSRLIVFIFAGLDFFALLFVRVLLKRYYLKAVRSGARAMRVIIIGTGDRAKELAAKLQQQVEWGVQIIGHLDPDFERVGQIIDDAPVMGTVADIHEILKKNIVDEVIIAMPRSLLEDAEPIAYACEEEGIRLRFLADIYNLHGARVSFSMVRDLPLLTMEPVAQDTMKLLAKRIFDFIVASLAMPLLLPVMALVALAIKLDSPGPVFFVQQRVGLRKRLFPLFKFRSMHVDAEERLKEIEHLNEAEGPIFKMSNDPRVTRVGRFIRKTSLDELPQFFNVLRGEMSLVGPRPMSQRDVNLFDKGIQRRRFSVKPGITCIWQISGRSNLPFNEWLRLDLEYIDNWSFFLDVKILWKTIPAVLFSKGAV